MEACSEDICRSTAQLIAVNRWLEKKRVKEIREKRMLNRIRGGDVGKGVSEGGMK